MNAAQELVDLLIRQLLAQRGEDVFEFSDGDPTSLIAIKDLEASHEVVDRTSGRIAARSIEDADERVEVYLSWCVGLELSDVGLGRILAERSQQIAEVLTPNRALAGLVEQRKGFLDVW